MPIRLEGLFVCIKYRGPKPGQLVQAKALPGSPRFLGRWYCVFIHEIDRLTSCPGANGQIDLLTCFALEGFQIWNGDGLHFDEAARVESFDLEDFSFGNDFAGFFVGSAANSGSCTEEALEDEHGISLSGGWFLKISVKASVMALPIDSPCFSDAVRAAYCAATYCPIAIDATVAEATPNRSATSSRRSRVSGRRRTDKVKSRSCFSGS